MVMGRRLVDVYDDRDDDDEDDVFDGASSDDIDADKSGGNRSAIDGSF
jgi:hypothetical protein